ncbi:MAG: carboxypeptidase regulatory-like domain-containing protein [Bacteroidota bacterium]|jgi:hypothetical protein
MKNTLKMILVIQLITFSLNLKASGEIRGKITDEQGNPAMGAIIRIIAGNHEVSGTASDMDGKYSIKPIEPGTYDLMIIFPQYKPLKIENVLVKNEDVTYVDAEIKPYGLDSMIEVKGYVKPAVDVGVVDMKTIGTEEMARMAVSRGDINSALVNVSSDVYQDPNDGLLYVRGARKDATQYIIDGEKMIGSMNVPATSIQSASIVTGGLPAQYGDLTGGLVIINTKDYFSGMREKNKWIRDREERKGQKLAEETKRKNAEKRAKEIEEQKQQLEKEKKK